MCWFSQKAVMFWILSEAYRLFQPSQKAAAERNLPGYAGEKYSWKSSDQTGKAG